VIQLTRSGVRLDLPEDRAAALRTAFAREHVLRLPAFLDPALAAMLETRLAGARFGARIEDGVEIEGTLEEPAVIDLFRFILNDPQLFDIVDGLTGCGAIGCFTGRVYRRRASTRPGEHYYPWHNDMADDRLVGLSINLGREPFEGGVLQVRDAVTHAPIVEIANTVFCDAVLFRISDALEHQVTPVEGRAMRMVMAGWFRARPSYLDAFEEAKADLSD
jgi:hypothetical protein